MIVRVEEERQEERKTERRKGLLLYNVLDGGSWLFRKVCG
jgi:hypothetical protein